MKLFQQHSAGYLLVALCLSLLGCEQGQRAAVGAQLQVGTNFWLGYEPLFLARDLNYWDHDQVRLIDNPSSTEMLRAFRSGSVDAATLTLDEALALVQDNIPISIILVHDISHGGDVIMANPVIQSMQDLKGKTLAVETSALGAVITTRALDIHGLNSGEINILSSHVNGHLELYKSGQIDAAVTYEPLRTMLLNAGAREIFSSREIPGEIVDVLVVRQSSIEKFPDQIQALVDGWFRALDFLQDHPQQGYSIIGNRLKMSVTDVEDMFEGIVVPDRAENISLLSIRDKRLSHAAISLNQIMVENYLINGMVEFEKLPLDSFVKSAPEFVDQTSGGLEP